MKAATYRPVLCDTHGNSVRNGIDKKQHAKDTAELNASFDEHAREGWQLIKENEVEKPLWFRNQERQARKLVRSLGLVAAKRTSITIVDTENPDVVEKLFPWDKDGIYTQAVYDRPYGIYIRKPVVEMARTQAMPRAIGKTLAHELTHSAEYLGRNYYQQYDYDTNEWITHQRQGFNTDVRDIRRGAFYSEGVAEFVAGLYARGYDRTKDALVSITDTPTAELPVQYREHNVDTGVPICVGPDAYALEVLAWGAEQKGIAPKDALIRSALATYSLKDSVRLEGFRSFARTINALRPGLYTDLRDLQLGHDAWQHGLDMALDAVTR